MKKYKNILGVFLMAVTMLSMASYALAAPSSTPTEVLESVVDSGINTSVGLVETVITSYFGYILIFSIVLGFIFWMKRFSKVGSR